MWSQWVRFGINEQIFNVMKRKSLVLFLYLQILQNCIGV